jgi:hypothetical protein
MASACCYEVPTLGRRPLWILVTHEVNQASFIKRPTLTQVLWLMPTILTTWEFEISVQGKKFGGPLLNK